MFEITQLYIGHIRNSIAIFDVQMQMFFGACVIGNLLFSSFGMNVVNNLEDEKLAFPLLWLFTIVIIVIVFVIIRAVFLYNISYR